MPRPSISVLLIVAGLGLCSIPAAGQVPDTGRGAPAATPDSVSRDVLPDTGAPAMPDSGATGLSDTAGAPLLAGAGSFAPGAIPVSILPDSGVPFIPVRSAGDLASAIDGMFLTTAGLGETARKYSVHGLREGSLAFLADGMLLNSPTTGLYDAGLYPLDFAERIEFISSPSGYAQASNAVGGAMNFVSRAERNPRPGSRIFYTQSAYNLTIVDAFVRQDVASGFNADLGLQRPVADGRFDNSAFDAWNTRLKLRYDAGGIAVYASDIYNRWERGMNDGISLSTPDSVRYDQYLAEVVNPSATERIVRHDAAAGVALGGGDGSITELDVRYTWAHREYRDEAFGTGSTGTPFRETREEEITGARLSHSRNLAWARLTATGEASNRRLLHDPNIGGERAMQAAIGLSVAATPHEAVSVVPAARLERYLDIDRLSVSATAIARISPGLAFNAGLSRSYRYPSFAETRGVAGFVDPLSAPDPERHDVITAGVSLGDSAGTHLSASWFHRAIQEGIIIDSAAAGGGAPLVYHRSAAETRDGGVFSAGLRVGMFLGEVDGTYLSYGAGTARRYAPEWDLRAGLYLSDRLVDGHLKLKTGFRGRYFTAFDGEGFAQRYGLFTPTGVRLGSAAVLDFLVFAGIGDAVIHIVWENLLAEEYAMTVFYPADDRTFRFGVTWKFLN